jgi:hypothetical protein
MKPTVIYKHLCVTEYCARLELTSDIAISCLSCDMCASIASVAISLPWNLVRCPSSFCSSLPQNTRSLYI